MAKQEYTTRESIPVEGRSDENNIKSVSDRADLNENERVSIIERWIGNIYGGRGMWFNVFCFRLGTGQIYQALASESTTLKVSVGPYLHGYNEKHPSI